MPLWKKHWLLFTVIWVVVAGLNAVSIVAFSEEPLERQRALVPAAFAVAVPAVTYLLLWLWVRWRARKK